MNDLDRYMDFGADYDSDAATVRLVQAKINSLGYSPALVVDGAWGPKTSAGVKWAQGKLKVAVTGLADDATLKAMGIAAPVPVASKWPPDPIKRPTVAVAVATMAKALRAAGAALGHPPSDTLVQLMLGQMLGAEGAMPGLWDGKGYTLRGTNNIGAAQVPGGANGTAFAAANKNTPGWGAYGHRDSNPPGPNGGPYLGWYYIAPSAEAAAQHWLTGFAGTKAVLSQNPSTPQEYASIMHAEGYFTGLTNDAATEIGKYAAAIQRGMPSIAEMNGPANDPAALSVAPEMFDTLAARQIDEGLYDQAKAGKSGSAWAYLLPATWAAVQASNGVVWFGPAPKTQGLIGRAWTKVKSWF